MSAGTWFRNIAVVVIVFLLGRSSVIDGWHEFLVRQSAFLLLAVLLGVAWACIDLLERRVKGKSNAAIKVTSPEGVPTNFPIKHCPKCGARLTSRAFQHIDSCRGAA